MKTKELDIINLFTKNSKLTSKDITEKLNLSKDISQTLRDLVYFEYLEKGTDDTFVRTNKPYNAEKRKKEHKPENYQIVLNKIFAGSFLDYNLGHELINFIKDDKGQRYVYLNPWGERSEKAAEETEYAFHIIESSSNKKEGDYELVAISKIDKNVDTIYNKNKYLEKTKSPIYNGHTFYEIFHCGSDSDKAHVYSYKASKFWLPKDNKKILIKISCEEAKFEEKNEDEVVLHLMCNPQHNICYADASGKITYTATRNKNTDIDVLQKLLLSKYVKINNQSIDLSDIDDEQCFSVISGRTNLEVSTSNQIAYFLQRDSNLTYLFLNKFLGVSDIKKKEKFEIIREKEKNIDLLFKSKNHIVVVENKIDSYINGINKKTGVNSKKESQLSKYYSHIEKKYKSIENRKYFILAPGYSEITQDILNQEYENGIKYTLKKYNDLFNILKDVSYKPLGTEASGDGKFLFKQFKKSIEYLTWSKARQQERTGYIRLKQRIKELDDK